MSMLACLRDKVTLAVEPNQRPRGANTNHDLRWIRAHVSGAARSVRPLSAVEISFPGVQFSTTGGVITATYRCGLSRVWVTEELADNRKAIQMIFEHEHTHLMAWEDASMKLLRAMAGVLEAQISGTPTVQLLSAALVQLEPRIWDFLLDTMAKKDVADWPQLHRKLLQKGVPAELRDSV